MEKEPKVSTIPEIPDKKFPSEKGYYHGIHVVINFHKKDGVDSREDQ